MGLPQPGGSLSRSHPTSDLSSLAAEDKLKLRIWKTPATAWGVAWRYDNSMSSLVINFDEDDGGLSTSEPSQPLSVVQETLTAAFADVAEFQQYLNQMRSLETLHSAPRGSLSDAKYCGVCLHRELLQGLVSVVPEDPKTFMAGYADHVAKSHQGSHHEGRLFPEKPPTTGLRAYYSPLNVLRESQMNSRDGCTINLDWPLCPFGLHGECRDPGCPYQPAPLLKS